MRSPRTNWHAGIAFRVVPSVSSFAVLAAAYRWLGAERAGSVAVGLAVAMFAQVADLGASGGYVNEVAAGSTTPPAEVTRWIARRSVPVALVLSATAAVLTNALGVDAFTTICVVAGLWSATIAAALLPFERRLYATHDYRSLDWSAIASSIAGLALVVAAGMTHGSPRAGLLAAAAFGIAPIARTLLVWRTDPSPPPRAAYEPDRAAQRSFLLLALIGTLSFSIDPLVAALVSSRSDAADVALISRFLFPVLLIGTIVQQRVWPEVARLSALSDIESLRRFYRSVTRRSVLATGAMVALIVPLTPLLARLTADRSGLPWSIVIASAIWTFIYSWGILLGHMFAGLGELRFMSKVGTLVCATNVPVSALLGHRYGAIGVIAGSIVTYVPIAFVPCIVRLRKLLRVPKTRIAPAVAVSR
jgi:O-antigen/teichoic acid export membrane protein